MDKFLRLHQELHARPVPGVRVGSTVFHLAMFRGDTPIERERAHIEKLAESVSAFRHTAGDSHMQLDIGGNCLRVEFHTEFTEYTFTKPSLTDFDEEPTTEAIAAEWIQGIAGETVNRLQISVEQVDRFATEAEAQEVFGAESIIGSLVSDGEICVWSDFRVSGRGNTRVLVQCKTTDADRIGRAVHRLISIENYRMLAFIGLEKARYIATPMNEVERGLERVMQRFDELSSIYTEKDVLAELIRLSAKVELLKTQSMNRFRATEAYSEIMSDRLGELRESKIEGCFAISEFLLRRSIPAFRTCRAAKDRILDLSLRVSRAAELLRTRIDLQIEEQNQQLLRSVDRRASMQNRLQLTIEWFSVVAITVYVLQLGKFTLDGVEQLSSWVNVPLIVGLMAPPVLLAVVVIMSRVRSRYVE